MRIFATTHSEAASIVDAAPYRVNFWQQVSDSWNLEAYVLTEARDVVEVLLWVEDNREDRQVEVFVEMDEELIEPYGEPRVAGLVRLVGTDPNQGAASEIGGFQRS